MAQDVHINFSSHPEADARVILSINQMGLILFTCDRDLRYTWVSHPLPGLTSVKMLGHTDDEIMGAENAAELMRLKRFVLTQTQPSAVDIALQLNGGTFPYNYRAGPLLDDGGNLTGLILAAVDISARNEAGQADARAAERANILASAAREGLILHDVERVFEVNEAFCRIFGIDRQTAIGMKPIMFLAPEFRREFALAQEKGIPYGPQKAMGQRSDGTVFPVELTLQRCDYQGRVSCVASFRDLTIQKDMEAALRESEERLRGFAEASSDVMWVIDAKTKQLEFLSPSFKEVFGDRPGEVLQDPDRMLKLVHPDDHETFMSGAMATLTGQRVQMEYRIMRPDGAVRWIHDTAFPVLGPDGQVRRAAGLARDVTLQKENEARQKLMLGELNHRVKNTLATIQSIARQTLRHASNPEAFQERFEDRLLALSQTHNLLTHENWEHGSLKALLEQELAPYGGNRVSLREGPDIYLAPRVVVPLAMALHELTTNAAKFGALSTQAGHLDVSWNITGDGSKTLRIVWREQGGPPIEAPPVQRGFGSRLLERGVKAELEGKVALEFRPQGLHAIIEIPLDSATPRPLTDMS